MSSSSSFSFCFFLLSPFLFLPTVLSNELASILQLFLKYPSVFTAHHFSFSLLLRSLLFSFFLLNVICNLLISILNRDEFLKIQLMLSPFLLFYLSSHYHKTKYFLNTNYLLFYIHLSTYLHQFCFSVLLKSKYFLILLSIS